jgi:succinate dehydrogenase / fumarate reductase cytochrome b subunit
MNNMPSPAKFPRWFDPRTRHLGTWGFILNRITALGLTLYLCLHLVMLFKLTQGAEVYDGFVKFANLPLIKAGEMLVIAAGLIHGLNGIRVGLTSFGIGVTYQKSLFVGFMIVALIGIIFFAAHMFSGV